MAPQAIPRFKSHQAQVSPPGSGLAVCNSAKFSSVFIGKTFWGLSAVDILAIKRVKDPSFCIALLSKLQDLQPTHFETPAVIVRHAEGKQARNKEPLLNYLLTTTIILSCQLSQSSPLNISGPLRASQDSKIWAKSPAFLNRASLTLPLVIPLVIPPAIYFLLSFRKRPTPIVGNDTRNSGIPADSTSSKGISHHPLRTWTAGCWQD